jgi:hypothetical protein
VKKAAVAVGSLSETGKVSVFRGFKKNIYVIFIVSGASI